MPGHIYPACGVKGDAFGLQKRSLAAGAVRNIIRG